MRHDWTSYCSFFGCLAFLPDLVTYISDSPLVHIPRVPFSVSCRRAGLLALVRKALSGVSRRVSSCPSCLLICSSCIPQAQVLSAPSYLPEPLFKTMITSSSTLARRNTAPSSSPRRLLYRLRMWIWLILLVTGRLPWGCMRAAVLHLCTLGP